MAAIPPQMLACFFSSRNLENSVENKGSLILDPSEILKGMQSED